MRVTIDKIKEVQNAAAEIDTTLREIARALYYMRKGKNIPSEYRYSKYFISAPGDKSVIDWGGKEFIQVNFTHYYYPDDNSDISVTFPSDWLGEDIVALEKERLERISPSVIEAKQLTVNVLRALFLSLENNDGVIREYESTYGITKHECVFCQVDVDDVGEIEHESNCPYAVAMSVMEQFEKDIKASKE